MADAKKFCSVQCDKIQIDIYQKDTYKNAETIQYNNDDDNNNNNNNEYLAPKTTRTSNAMDIELTIVWKVIIYHERNLKKVIKMVKLSVKKSKTIQKG